MDEVEKTETEEGIAESLITAVSAVLKDETLGKEELKEKINKIIDSHFDVHEIQDPVKEEDVKETENIKDEEGTLIMELKGQIDELRRINQLQVKYLSPRSEVPMEVTCEDRVEELRKKYKS